MIPELKLGKPAKRAILSKMSGRNPAAKWSRLSPFVAVIGGQSLEVGWL
jgi:hypothetical protein